MASTSNTGRQPDDEHTNASQEIASSPSISSTLFSSCFNWLSFFLSLCSTQSHSSPDTSSSTPLLTNAFQEIVSTSATSSMSGKKVPYDVFINHRGPDVKHTLAATLYHTLSVMGLRVFLDSQELQLGEYLPKEIEEAMHSASLHIAILSKTYAQSPWCLAELSYMLKTGTQIIPIFYHLQPGQVRHGKGMYADAFSQHIKKGRYSSEKIQEWKKAVEDVCSIVGEIIDNNDDCGRVVKNIVSRVLKVIQNVPFVVAKHPVGLDEAVIDFERTTLESPESESIVQIVGIWGMGGSGKTTLAKQLYNKKYTTMEKSSFLLDIRDADSKSVLHQKQQKLLGDLGLQGVSVDNIEEGKGILASRLRSVRVLIVLDDVDNVDQMDALVPEKDSLGRGSLIVVTTRKLEVLQRWGISSIYKMKALDPPYAKKLFCWHAFLKPCPDDGFENLVEEFIEACNGLPLSLKVFGAQLYGISNKDYWKNQLQKIVRILPDNIKNRLKISYDALDYEEKEAFLDAACFCIGQKKTSVIAAWDGSIGSGLCSWESLLNKCLIELVNDEYIRMHDHLRDLGREIANHQSPYRLWSSQQIINVHNDVQGIAIRAIMVTRDESTSEVEQFPQCSERGELKVNTSRGFRSLAPSSLGLKILQVSGNYYNQVIGDLSRELVWLRWFSIEQRNLHSLNSMKNLRVLELYQKRDGKNHLEELWETDSNAPVQLRELLISDCSEFQRFPESIGCLRHLKKIVVSGGSKVSNLPDEFCLLQSLEHLELERCRELSSLPCSFGDLRNLRHLRLSDCVELRKLPVSFKKLALLQHLNLQKCSNLILDSDILENMTHLEHLSFSGCRELEELPRHITNQASLTLLNLNDTGKLRDIPVNIGQLSKLQQMRIGSELLTSLPTSIGDLSSLTNLQIVMCPNLECLPDSLGRLNLLEWLYIKNSGVKSLPKSAGQLINLQTLSISNCSISELDLVNSSLHNLKIINLDAIEVCKVSISEDCCPGLESLHLSNNNRLTEIDVLPTAVKTVYLVRCKMLRNIKGIEGLVNIQSLSIIGCPELDALPSFAQSTFLQQFELKGCYGVKKIHGLEHCRALERLTVDTRWKEAGIGSLERMVRLRHVDLRAISRPGVEGCIQSMKKFPDETFICTRAVPDAASLVNSFDFVGLSVVDSFAKQEIKSGASLKCPSSACCLLLCFVVNCESPNTSLNLFHNNLSIWDVPMEEGKWVWTGVITQHSRIHNRIPLHGQSRVEFYSLAEAEKGLVVRGEEERVVEAFNRLWVLLSD
ncbi:TMV resistance protein N isoform X2 [Cryptomeria japonica]|uniref:TMV resistance protein N isoform X2 n=1 Tax=Cryptomeria japonica TaxID=3369 RepID=UPI0027DA4DC4|nr:TMV resistance protein N isoform X2 [Cryptomeria japonica]